MTRNQIDYWRLKEDKRHQKELERETERANRQASRDKRFAAMADLAARNRQAIINSDHYTRMDSETNRHNLELERLQALAHENERARITLGYDQLSNAQTIAHINAGVGYAGVGAQYANIAEMNRANLAREQQLANELAETMRRNRSQENISQQQLGTQRLQAYTQARKQSLAEEQWRQVGYNQGIANIINTSSQTQLNQARSELTKVQTELAPVESTIKSATSVINSLDNFNQRFGGNRNGTKPKKGSVQWPDGSVTSPKR